ncbi:hypothetical protein PLICRDRAFT_449333 [Plicaturopsis crispa FD-325 SS-3]|uniref:Uncharacterized protein n=1 Tax=Plicaturopsis crispa FD-325 SS-3 TaxID=944288 RepID=A0A0C9SJW0_PLICR|nr:hypothetical protein PLICRDRAFT_449333 [Plicaturopsis crispa FD-325 SS-3]
MGFHLGNVPAWAAPMGSIAGSLCESTYLLDGGLCRQAALPQVGSSSGGLVTSYGYLPSTLPSLRTAGGHAGAIHSHSGKPQHR